MIQIKRVSYNGHPFLVSEQCLYHCITTQTCDTIFVSYHNNSDVLESCEFFLTGLNQIEVHTIGENMTELSFEPWNTMWPGGSGVPTASELWILGIF